MQLHDDTKWGFPGGKVDPGETAEIAIVRETLEETGLVINPALLTSVYAANEGPFLVTTFTVPFESVDFSTLKGEEGLTLNWKNISTLTDHASSPFAHYNQEAIQSFENIQKKKQRPLTFK